MDTHSRASGSLYCRYFQSESECGRLQELHGSFAPLVQAIMCSRQVQTQRKSRISRLISHFVLKVTLTAGVYKGSIKRLTNDCVYKNSSLPCHSHDIFEKWHFEEHRQIWSLISLLLQNSSQILLYVCPYYQIFWQQKSRRAEKTPLTNVRWHIQTAGWGEMCVE